MQAPTRSSEHENGQVANRLRIEDSSVHRWYRFVLSFPPHLVRNYVSRFELGAADVVLDPFCGTGTTLVECKKLGIDSTGIEKNPIAHFASTVKTDWMVDPSALAEHAQQIAAAARSRLASQGLSDWDDLPLFADKPSSAALASLPTDAEKLLLRNSISPLPLHKALTLIEALQEHHDSRFADHERLALAKALLSGISNLEFGPEVGVGKPKLDAPVIAIWMDCVAQMVEDLELVKGIKEVPGRVLRQDSRCVASALPPQSVAAVMTSPPYPNEKDYTRTTRLESVLLGFLRDKADLRQLKNGLVRSNTRGVYKSDTDDQYVADHPEIQRIAAAIEARRLELGKTSGFERMYARVTKLYFGGMARHLDQLRAVLRPGAHLAYVVGDQASYLRVMIRTGQILAEIAERLGYQVVSLDLFRTRLATATREQLREEVLVLRWPDRESKIP